jgi:hypothetical protein
MPAPGGRALREIETWIFDLDNTLYPASCRLFDQIHARMTHFIADRLDLTLEAALTVQKTYFRAHGTTLRGLMTVDRSRGFSQLCPSGRPVWCSARCCPHRGAGGPARPQDRPHQRLASPRRAAA